MAAPGERSPGTEPGAERRHVDDVTPYVETFTHLGEPGLRRLRRRSRVVAGLALAVVVGTFLVTRGGPRDVASRPTEPATVALAPPERFDAVPEPPEPTLLEHVPALADPSRRPPPLVLSLMGVEARPKVAPPATSAPTATTVPPLPAAGAPAQVAALPRPAPPAAGTQAAAQAGARAPGDVRPAPPASPPPAATPAPGASSPPAAAPGAAASPAVGTTSAVSAPPPAEERRAPPPAAPSPASRAERVVVARAPSPAAPLVEEVQGLLERYAVAFGQHDVEALRAIGQVKSDQQAQALRDYFEGVQDLSVEVRVLDVRNDGERMTVRFTRRDRFRDPAGRQVMKEFPPLEKEIVRTPQGLRFGPRG
jgi:hypothetical protein